MQAYPTALLSRIKFKFADIMNVELQQSKLKSHSNSYKITKILHNQQHYKLLNKFTGFSMKTTPYHWTLLRGPPRAEVPSIILCVKKWNLPAPQRGGSSHSGEGKNGRFHLIKTERRGYKNILLVELKIYTRMTYKTCFGRIG